MKNKIFLGLLSVLSGFAFISCIDEGVDINPDPILNESSVTTGSADVTATSATLYGSVEGLDGMAASSYNTAFYYGYSEDALTESVNAAYDGKTFVATISGLENNTKLYYQAYVRLQGKVFYKGDVKSLITTNAKVTTKAAAEVGNSSAVLGGTLTDASAGSECGIVISASSDVEAIRSGVKVAAAYATDFAVTYAGLLPDTEYYYVAYLDLGSGVLYGDVESFTTSQRTFDVDNDLVDLGLSVKWAKYNIGARIETDLGGLFGFGDLNGVMASINPADYASSDTYKTASDLAYMVTDGKATLPSAADFEELFSLCAKEWTEIEGVAGYKLTGPNGNSIFLPAAGSRIQSDIEGVGTEGYYLTGTINPTNSQFAVTYQFNSSTGTKATTPVYQAVAVRPVSTAKNIPFEIDLLQTRWYLDNGQTGAQKVFEGPYTQYGITDSWATITNGQPNIEQSIYWEMGTGNGWIGYTYGKDYGYMEFLEDGVFNVHRIAEDGTVTEETGTYTVDVENKTLTVDVDVIHGNTWLPSKKGTLKVLSMDEFGMRIMLDAGDGTYGYALNYYSERKNEADAKIPVSLLCVDGNWAGTWGSVVDNIAPADIEGQHTFTYNGASASAMVFTLDFQGLIDRFPSAVVVINDMKCDGESIMFDANHFFYGDIENNGNYRIELFNIWGKGSADGVVVNSPFSNGQNLASEPAFNFAETFEVTYTIITNPVYTPNLITINPSWGGPWDYNQGASFSIAVDKTTAKLVINNPSIDMTYSSADHSAGSIMTFIETKNLYQAFPGAHATLDAMILDGVETSFDASKLINTDADGGKTHHRLEIWNCYGATAAGGCAFGESVDGTVAGLGFSSSMQVKFTFDGLFATPIWE